VTITYAPGEAANQEILISETRFVTWHYASQQMIRVSREVEPSALAAHDSICTALHRPCARALDAGAGALRSLPASKLRGEARVQNRDRASARPGPITSSLECGCDDSVRNMEWQTITDEGEGPWERNCSIWHGMAYVPSTATPAASR
jgi:hypothetical protein